MKRWLILIPFLLIFHIASAQDSENAVGWLRLNTLDGWQVLGELTSVCITDSAGVRGNCISPVARDLPLISELEPLPISNIIHFTLGETTLTEPLHLQLLDEDSNVVAEASIEAEANSEVEWQPEVDAGEYTLTVDAFTDNWGTTLSILYRVRILTPDELEDFFPHTPPMFLQTAENQWVEGLEGGYCFPPDEETMGCVEVFMLPLPEEYVAVPNGNSIQLRLGALPHPESVILSLVTRDTTNGDRTDLRHEYDLTGNPLNFTWTPNAAPGEYALHVQVQWSETSHAYYVFGVTLAEPIVTVSEPPQFSLWTADNIIVGGQQGSYCWDDGTGHLCRDFMFDTPEVYHSLLEGNVLYIVVQSNNAPNQVYASFFTPDMESVLSSVEMQAPEPGIFTLIIEDLPEGDYIVIIGGVWDEGDSSNVFGIHVGQ